jgi:hypothetical protein
MIAVLKPAESMWIVAEHGVRLVHANRPNDLATEDAIILKPAVRVGQHDHVFNTKYSSRFRLFFLANGDDAIARHIVIVGTATSVGAHHIHHLASTLYPFSDCGAGAYLGIIRMGTHNHGAFRYVVDHRKRFGCSGLEKLG